MSKQRTILWLIAIGLIALLATPFVIYLTRFESTSPPSPLEEAVARIPLGANAQEVDQLVGSQPDSVRTHQVIVANAALILDPANPLGKEYGKAKPYSFRRWSTGGTHASVVLDKNDKVVAKTIFHDSPDR